MSIRIQYAYLKQQTWLYRRNYPKELQGVGLPQYSGPVSVLVHDWS
jgi:hypothetical protein